jgi:hypothetical protein
MTMKLSWAQDRAIREMKERGAVRRRRGGWSSWRWADPKQYYVPFNDATIRALKKKNMITLRIDGDDEVAELST